jgi:hypothetical protein
MRARDPRDFQIAALALLLAWGVTGLGFDIRPGRIALLLSTALLAQLAGTRLFGLPRFDPKSALISALSLCLLLRTGSAVLAGLAAVIAIGSKFVVRWRGKHLFNPTNIGIVALLGVGAEAWVSPGQWGSVAFLAFLFAGIGFFVVHRAARADVTIAFLACYAGLLIGRSLWLGEPLAIPLHRLQSGALLLFSFFMISDPKTTPDSRLGRLLFAALVAGGAWYIQFRLFRTNGLLWSLAGVSLLVPLIDRLLPGSRYDWRRPSVGSRSSLHEGRSGVVVRPDAGLPLPAYSPVRSAQLFSGKESVMRSLRVFAVGAIVCAVFSGSAHAFCGFYVAKADTKLFNKASKVVMVRDGNRTVMTMASDFRGDPKEFAMVVPVPTFLERGQIHVGERAAIDHLDAYSAPRLVEYFDEDPCRPRYEMDALRSASAPMAAGGAQERAKSLGVTIEASYTVGEYDILILSAKESSGLEAWLVENGYRVPKGASEILGSYLRQNLRFFVAKVNLIEQAKLGFSYLRPLQIAYESPKFMLPVRLGTVNADGVQEIFVFALSRQGRVETTNYRTVRLPSGMDLPVYVKNEFGPFYRDMFTRQTEAADLAAVFLEYAWDMSWCDPCAAEPLSKDELEQLGVFWLDEPSSGGGVNVFLTRLHTRYDGAHFPEDLVFQQTQDRENFQGRFVLRHAWTGEAKCAAAADYVASLDERHETEARTLAELTGWRLVDIRKHMGLARRATRGERSWWERLWGDGGR